MSETGGGAWGVGCGEAPLETSRGGSSHPTPHAPIYQEFAKRRDGMIHAMDGGLWLHRHVWKGHPMAHLVSVDRDRLLAYGRVVGLPERRLQYKPLKDPRTGERREAWHWDLVGEYLPKKDREGVSASSGTASMR